MSRNGLGDQIAVLDGLDLAAADVVAGEGEQMLALAAGGTRSGGSSWEPGIPTMYGRADLAGLQELSADFDLTSKMDLLNVIVNPEKQFMDFMNNSGKNIQMPKDNVINPSGGANYSGGTTYTPGVPLVSSSSGLAGASRRVRKNPNAPRKAPMPQRQPLNLKVQQIMPGVQTRANVIDPSGGANYGGGSTFYDGSPLLPSSSGLARMHALDGMAALNLKVQQIMPGVQTRANVIDPSGGANYGGGGSYYGGSPLLPSNAGLADCNCDGAMSDLQDYASKVTQPMRDFQTRSNVIDPSGGANYGGGSDYFPGSPLIASSSGLSATAPVENKDLQRKFANAVAFQEFAKIGGENEIKRLEKQRNAAVIARAGAKVPPLDRQLAVVRLFRTKVMSVPMSTKLTKQGVQKLFLMSMSEVQGSPASTTVQGLAGLNLGLANLEGRIGKKIRKGLKSGVKGALKAGVKLATSAAKVSVGIPPGLNVRSMAKGLVGRK